MFIKLLICSNLAVVQILAKCFETVDGSVYYTWDKTVKQPLYFNPYLHSIAVLCCIQIQILVKSYFHFTRIWPLDLTHHREETLTLKSMSNEASKSWKIKPLSQLLNTVGVSAEMSWNFSCPQLSNVIRMPLLPTHTFMFESSKYILYKIYKRMQCRLDRYTPSFYQAVAFIKVMKQSVRVCCTDEWTPW